MWGHMGLGKESGFHLRKVPIGVPCVNSSNLGTREVRADQVTWEK